MSSATLGKTNEELEHEDRVRSRVFAAVSEGKTQLMTILPYCEGADPRLVVSLLSAMQADGALLRGAPDAASFREAASNLPWKMPAADPILGQWWFTLSTIDWLTSRINSELDPKGNRRVLCLGTPTIAFHLSEMDLKVRLLDADPDVLKAVQSTSKALDGYEHDLLEGLPDSDKGTYDAVVLDPPWYMDEFEAFIRAAMLALRVNGHGYISVPALLTRPTVVKERRDLLKSLDELGATIVSLESARLDYVVPEFERVAYADLDGFTGRPWRSSDLVHFRKVTDRPIEPSNTPTRFTKRRRFAVDPSSFRVFMVQGQSSASEHVLIKRVEGFEKSVSRRTHEGSQVDVWTTAKIAARVESSEITESILRAWSDRQTPEDAAKTVEREHNKAPESATELVKRHNDVLQLWTHQHQTEKRDTEEIAAARRQARSVWATPPTKREHFDVEDGYRLQYQRDRDRILWSAGLRRLANKTQLFPVDEDDQVRQRLAHSIEVMQLASTIAESFGLDRDLVEAAALAHDIGHAPFGHAGEVALDKALRKAHPKLSFNHHEHGADVVRYLDDSYQASGPRSHAGLDLVPEVCEAVLKHAYQHDLFRLESKHIDPFIPRGYCHLEGQAVRLADKISYLVSDLEDGIRLGAIPEEAIAECRLFHRPPIDMSQPRGTSLLKRFLVQRRNIIRVLMEDAITAMGRKLAQRRGQHDTPNVEIVRAAGEYMVEHSSDVSKDVGEVWEHLQSGLLHRDPRVRTANLGATRIVSQLFVLFSVFPEYVDAESRTAHKRLARSPYMSFYRAQTRDEPIRFDETLLRMLPLDLMIDPPRAKEGLPLEDVIAAKDYVAGLTDARARSLYAKYGGEGGWTAR